MYEWDKKSMKQSRIGKIRLGYNYIKFWKQKGKKVYFVVKLQ